MNPHLGPPVCGPALLFFTFCHSVTVIKLLHCLVTRTCSINGKNNSQNLWSSFIFLLPVPTNSFSSEHAHLHTGNRKWWRQCGGYSICLRLRDCHRNIYSYSSLSKPPSNVSSNLLLKKQGKYKTMKSTSQSRKTSENKRFLTDSSCFLG